MKKTSIFANGLIWFGAGVSIAEILTGASMASMGFGRGLAAILLGHVIGCVLLFLAGLIGGRTGLSAMETVKQSFGQKGGLLFSVLNVLQLVGWTAVMVLDGGLAANTIFGVGAWVWQLLIGALILVWIFIGITNLGRINTVAMAALFILTLVLSGVIFKNFGAVAAIPGEGLAFGAGVELAVAMPLSWLPLISDYTREAEKPLAATAASALVYFAVSCWMYVIGMGAALFAGTSDIAAVVVQAGIGVIGLIIIVFSTVTTTFLDAYSAGVSAESIHSGISAKTAAIVATVLGTGLTMFAAFGQMEYQITDFLYLIGSVFAPMIAVQIADHFLLRRPGSARAFEVKNLLVWLAGFVLYRLCMNWNSPLGYTLPVMLATMLLCVAVHKLLPEKAESK